MIIQKKKNILQGSSNIFKIKKRNIFSFFIVGGMSLFLANQVYGMEKEYKEYRVCGQPKVLPRDFGLDEGPRLSLIRTEASKWLNGTRLFYNFLENDGGDEDQKDAVRSAFQEWKNLGIGLSFQEESDPNKAQIKIGFDPTIGSWSYVGRDTLTYAKGAVKSMNFGWDLTTDYGHITALHEIGHALGFPHEHQSPFSGIVWNTSAVYQYFQGPPNNWDKEKIDNNIISKLPKEEVRGSDWDQNSVMHYQFKAGLIDVPPEYQTQDLTPPLKLSEKDIDWVRKFYPPLSEESSPLVPFHSNFVKLNPGGQRDFSIQVAKSRAYTIQTFGLTDAVMVLFDKENMSVIKGDDNSGGNKSDHAIISANLQDGKDYILKLRLHYAKEGIGSIMLY